MSLIGCSDTPIGCAVCFASTQARPFSFTFQVEAGGAGRETSPFLSASAISALLRGAAVYAGF